MPNINLGSNNQVGAVSVGSVAGRDVYNFTISDPSQAFVDSLVGLLERRAQLSAGLGVDTAHYAWGHLIAEKLTGFIGRAHVFAAIERFLTGQPNGYLFIEGDPGMGKSTVLGEYVRRTGCLAHVNSRHLGISSASQFLHHLCVQLITAASLPYPQLPPETTRDGAFLNRLLHEAAATLAPGERLVIAVDALDEVSLAGADPDANLLYLPASLPANVYFILTRRRVDLPLMLFAPQETIDLTAYAAENRSDIVAYLQQAIQRPALAAWITAQGLTTAAFVELLAERSEHNFMYLHLVLSEIEQGAYADLHAQMLPRGLAAYYEDHWKRMGMRATPPPRAKIAMIYIICEARAPVSSELIAYVARRANLTIDAIDIQQMLDEWRQFLHMQPLPTGTRYSLYHTSFQDFLYRKEVIQKAGVTIPQINALIAESLLAELYADPPDDDL